MSALDRSRLVAGVLSLVPGWGHIYWGREGRGLTLFTLFATAAFVLLNGLFLYLGAGRSWIVGAGAAAAVAIAAWTWIDILRLTSPARARELAALRNASLRDGTLAYLQGRLADAKTQFQQCLREDPADVEALFRLGVVCARAGETREARTHLRRAARTDLDEKWAWEIDRELERLSGDRPSTGRPPRELVPATALPRHEPATESRP